MRRVVVAGRQGSGKTTLALELGRTLGLPVIHLDVLYWRPGWKRSDKDEFRARVRAAIAGEAWVIDGSFAGLAMDLTVARADTFVVVDRPRWQCLWRVILRSIFQRDRRRTDLPEGCPEMLDWGLLKQVWRYDADRRPEIEEERARFGAHLFVVRLRGDREIAAFVAASSPAT